MNWRLKSAFKVCAVFTGSVVGAGFASGQEIYRFFGVFGARGTIGLAISLIMLFFTCRAMFLLCARKKIGGFMELLSEVAGPSCARFYHVVTTAFLFVVFGVMGSAMGALSLEALSINNLMGFFAYLALMLVVLYSGGRGLSRLCSILSPIMVGGVALLCLYVLVARDVATFSVINFVPIRSDFVLAALLYCGYNALLACAAVCSLGRVIEDEKTARLAALLCGLVPMACAGIVYFALRAFYGSNEVTAIPIWSLALSGGRWMQALYFIILGCAIVTTGAAGGLVITRYLGGNKGAPLVLCAAALPFCLFDFSFLIERFYGFFGVLGLGLCIILIVGERRSSP